MRIIRVAALVLFSVIAAEIAVEAHAEEDLKVHRRTATLEGSAGCLSVRRGF